MKKKQLCPIQYIFCPIRYIFYFYRHIFVPSDTFCGYVVWQRYKNDWQERK